MHVARYNQRHSQRQRQRAVRDHHFSQMNLWHNPTEIQSNTAKIPYVVLKRARNMTWPILSISSPLPCLVLAPLAQSFPGHCMACSTRTRCQAAYGPLRTISSLSLTGHNELWTANICATQHTLGTRLMINPHMPSYGYYIMKPSQHSLRESRCSIAVIDHWLCDVLRSILIYKFNWVMQYCIQSTLFDIR